MDGFFFRLLGSRVGCRLVDCNASLISAAQPTIPNRLSLPIPFRRVVFVIRYRCWWTSVTCVILSICFNCFFFFLTTHCDHAFPLVSHHRNCHHLSIWTITVISFDVRHAESVWNQAQAEKSYHKLLVFYLNILLSLHRS
jgi:hypothetical protein